MLQVDTRLTSSVATVPPLAIDTRFYDDRSWELAVCACRRLRFRIAVAISSFQLAEWEATSGHEGLHMPSSEVDGHVFPPYDMCDEERTWFLTEAEKRRKSAREGIATSLAPHLINLIETNARNSRESSYLLAWELMATFVDLFEPVYLAIAKEARSPYYLAPLPSLAATMIQQHEKQADWCPTVPRQSIDYGFHSDYVSRPRPTPYRERAIQ